MTDKCFTDAEGSMEQQAVQWSSHRTAVPPLLFVCVCVCDCECKGTLLYLFQDTYIMFPSSI